MLVFGDDPKDREVVLALAKAAGLRGVHAGPLANSVAAEALTSVLIGINRNYKVDGAGIRITGIGVACGSAGTSHAATEQPLSDTRSPSRRSTASRRCSPGTTWRRC